ncbi:hypothetical protein D3C81_2190980 [compost metagenome]
MRSFALTRNSPLLPEVPEDMPIVTEPIMGVKSRLASACSARENASSLSTPTVFNRLKCSIISDFSMIGNCLQSLSGSSPHSSL